MTQTAPPNFRILATSVQGTSHLRSGLPCQDAYAFAEASTGELIVAVADGAGSAEFSEEGSALAVTTAVQSVQSALHKYRPTSQRAWQLLVERAFHDAHHALTATACARHCETRHFATTLLLLLSTAQQTLCGLIGDCAAVVRTADGALRSLCPPQRGEYANTTNFLVLPNYATLLNVTLLTQPVSSAALFSDGLAPLAMNLTKNEPFTPFFEPLFAFLASATDASSAGQQLADFLSSERINARTDDDKTLVLIQRIAQSSV